MTVRNEWSVWIERYSERREKIHLCNYSGNYEDAIAKGRKLADGQLGAIVVVRLGQEYGAIHKEQDQRKRREKAFRDRIARISAMHHVSGMKITRHQLDALIAVREEEIKTGKAHYSNLQEVSGGRNGYHINNLVIKGLIAEDNSRGKRLSDRVYRVTESGSQVLREARKHGWI